MKNYCDMCFKCNDTNTCTKCEQRKDCIEFDNCVLHTPSVMWVTMISLDDIMRWVEKWRLYSEQTIKQ